MRASANNLSSTRRSSASAWCEPPVMPARLAR
ncbi:hypothetical protein ABIB94_009380, partial [Bradyrhizobium sp. JR7.2]